MKFYYFVVENLGKEKNGKFIICYWCGSLELYLDEKRVFIEIRLREIVLKWYLDIIGY